MRFLADHRATVLASGVVALLAFVAYANSLANGFVMDDRYNVVENSAIRTLRGIPQLVAQPLGANARRSYDRIIAQSYWRPLTLATYAVDYQLWGLRPFGYHLTNVLVHAANSVLVLWLLLQLALAWPAALSGALLFALHPVHSEAVNLVTYRTELLASCFVLLALVLHAGRRPSICHDVVVLPLLYAAGLSSKETAVTLPGWLLLLDLALGRLSAQSWPERARLLLRRYGPLAMVLGAYLVLRQVLLKEQALDFFAGLSPGLRLLSVATIYAVDVRLLFWPWPLVPFYDWTILPPASSWHDGQAYLGVGLFLATVLLALLLGAAARTGRPRLGVAALGVGWWLVGLVPFLHLVRLPVGAAERFLYLPSVGFCLALGLGYGAWLARQPRLALVVGLCLVSLMLGANVQRNTHWRSDLQLREQTARDYPSSFSAQHYLGEIYREHGRLVEARRAYERANRLLPNILPNVVPLAALLVADCQQTRALALLDAALAEHGSRPELLRLRSLAQGRRCAGR